MKITTKLGDNDRLAGRDFHQARIGLAHFKRQTLRAIRRHGREWPISTQRDPVTIIFSWKIILETIPVFLGLIEPVDMPNPSQVACALGAHHVNYMPVSGDVAWRPFSCAAVPFAIPAEPVS